MSTSLASLGSSKSTLSQKRRRNTYVGKKSNVDETLFGPPARLKQMTGNRSWGSTSTPSVLSSQRGTDRGSNDPEIVQVVTKDLIRKIRVPGTPDPSGFSVVLDRNAFGALKERSKVLSAKERASKEQAMKAEKNSKFEAVNTRKQVMQQLEITRKKNEKPSDLDQEQQEMGSELLSKAKIMMEEQDDEIKKLNELILNAKCHSIRDAQLKEKNEVQEAQTSEEKRLDDMMEIDRIKALQDYEEREVERNLQRLRGAEVIKQQIEDREQHRLLEAERKDQETQSMLRYLERLQQEDMDNLCKKRDAQVSLMDEVAKCNEEIQRQKLVQREQQKLEDIRVMEYHKEKERREEELQVEAERLKTEKEKEIARLRAQQERANDKQAERDALKAKRRHEEFEREWRRKEKEEAFKKAQTEQMLIGARQKQVQNKEHFLAVQAQRDRAEFERVLKVQQELMDAEKHKNEHDADKRKLHATEVRKQVRMKEEEKIQARRNFFEEGIKLDQEAKERRQKLDEIKQRKLAELRAAGIPEKYCAEVSRRITAPPPSFTMST